MMHPDAVPWQRAPAYGSAVLGRTVVGDSEGGTGPKQPSQSVVRLALISTGYLVRWQRPPSWAGEVSGLREGFSGQISSALFSSSARRRLVKAILPPGMTTRALPVLDEG